MLPRVESKSSSAPLQECCHSDLRLFLQRDKALICCKYDFKDSLTEIQLISLNVLIKKTFTTWSCQKIIITKIKKQKTHLFFWQSAWRGARKQVLNQRKDAVSDWMTERMNGGSDCNLCFFHKATSSSVLQSDYSH